MSSDIGADINGIIAGSTTVVKTGETVQEGVDKLGGSVMEYIEVIRNKISTLIADGSGEVNKFIKQQVEKVKASVEQGAESLKNTLNEQIEGIFGTDTGGGTGMASLCSFSYSDYLRLFGLYANEENVVLRIGDVIQTNMAKCATKKSGYKLVNSAAYVKVNAKIQVKPTLLALPIFADVEKNPINNANWYTITYSGISGY